MPEASTQTASQDTVQATLLRASAMQHLFRALIAVESAGQMPPSNYPSCGSLTMSPLPMAVSFCWRQQASRS